MSRWCTSVIVFGRAVIAVACAVFVAPPAAAQAQADPASPAAQPAGQPAESISVARSTGSPTGPLDISLVQVGVGGLYRPGDPVTAIRVAITTSIDLKSNVVVQWRVPDADGELASFERVLSLTPGRPTLVWLYAPVPTSYDDNTVSVVQVFKVSGDKLGEEVGAMRFSPRDAAVPAYRVDPFKGMIAVIGRASVGVEDYRSPTTGQSDNPPWAHEETIPAVGIRPDELPDRWYPLQSFDAVIWSADAVPQELRIDPANALREYVMRGGHLVIILSQAGDAWGWGAAQNPAAHKSELDDLLPAAAPRHDEGVPLQDLIDVLGKSRYLPKSPIGKPINFNLDIRVFKQLKVERDDDSAGASQPGSASASEATPFSAISLPWQPLIALHDGRVVAIQRTYGHGRISILGIDVGYGQLRAAGLPQADVWWNRILGRRSDTPRAGDWAIMDQKGFAYRTTRQASTRIAGSSELIEGGIRMGGVASKATLLAVLLFIAYFLAAGPLGFLALRHYRVPHHSWLVFVGTAGLFTLVAWGSVSLMRGTTVRVQHITYLDHVAETKADGRTSERQLQRAVSWMSIFLPGYGRPRVAIEPYEHEPNILLSWHPPSRATVERFPNVDRYRVDIANHPADYEVPGRATAKQFYANYLGPVAATWGEMFAVDPKDPIRVEHDLRGDRLVGSISHNLPGILSNVSFIWIQEQRYAARRFATDSRGGEQEWVTSNQSGQMLNIGRFWRQGGAASYRLEPGKSYALQSLLTDVNAARLDVNIKMLYIDPYKPTRGLLSSVGGPVTDTDKVNFRQMLSIFAQLTPPDYISGGPEDSSDADNVYMHRELGRELDLSPWFNRPCLIIIGELRGAACPVPLVVDGRLVKETDPDSLTIVRWICPLEVNEARISPIRAPRESPPAPPAKPDAKPAPSR